MGSPEPRERPATGTGSPEPAVRATRNALGLPAEPTLPEYFIDTPARIP